MIQTEVLGLQEFGRKLGVKVSALERTLTTATQEITMRLVAEVKANKLSGQVLKVRTGRLRRSITGRVRSSDGVITGEVGTNVDYGLIHEFGGAAGMATAKATFAQQFKVAGPFPKRAFLRPTLAESQEAIKKRMAQAVAEAIRA